MRDDTVIERASQPSPSSRGPRVDADELSRRLGLSSRYLAGRLLVALGADADGTLGGDVLVSRLRALASGTPDDKLRFAFRVHDENDDGVIDAKELERLLHIALAESGLALGDDTAEALVRAMLRHADRSGDGAISWDEFRSALQHFPGVLEHLTLGDLGSLGLAPTPPADSLTRAERALRSHGLSWLLLGTYLAVNLLLFVDAWVRYEARGAPVLVQLARGCGACLNLHGALVLLPMMRRTLTMLGRTVVGRVLIDDHVGFHRVVGSGAFYLGVAHSVAHLLNFASRGGSLGLLEGVITWAGTTGIALLAVHVALFAFARSPIRKRPGRFELFAITHRLYPVWLALLLLHGPVAWMWMSLPVLWFAADRFFGRRVRRARIVALEALPSGTARVRIARPAGFDYAPGDYVFVRVPALARFEWHPFTLSSAPSDPELTLHVRASGDWTKALRDLATSGARELEIDVDGPYGTATSHALESRYVVLVGAGIGVTPFASLLRALLAGAASQCEHVHFVWVCREQRAFEWFAELLGEVERRSDRFTVDIFLDSARSDARSTVLQVAMDALYADTRRDLVTGLRSRTTLGAPDWDALLGEIAQRRRPEPVHCFFCGPEGLAARLRSAAQRHGLVFRQEHF